MLLLDTIHWMSIFNFITEDPTLNNRTVYSLIENELKVIDNVTEHHEWLDENGNFVKTFNFSYLNEPSDENGNRPTPENSTLFQFTARQGFFDVFKCMIENKAIEKGITRYEAIIDVLKEHDRRLFTPIHLAVEGGHLNIVKYLIDEIEVASILPDTFKTTLLQIAAASNQLNVIRYLVEEKNTSFDTLNALGRTPVHDAVQYSGKVSLIIYFDKKGVNLTAPGGSRVTLMRLAAMYDRLEIMMHLIEVKHLDPNICDIDGNCPLHYAVSCGQTDIVTYLISHKANVNQRTRKGKTALHIATIRGHLDLVKYLIGESADIYAVDDNNNTVLHTAIDTNYGLFLDVVRYLVDDKAMSIYLRNNQGATPFHISAKKVFHETLEFFVEEKGADLTRVDNNGWTTLHYAIRAKPRCNIHRLSAFKAFCKHVQCYGQQEEEDVTLSRVDNNALAAVYYDLRAKSRCNIDLIKYIVSKKVDVNVPDRDGKTALHHSVKMKNLVYVKYFIEEGKANMKAVDNKGRSILHYACYKHAIEIVKYLIDIKRMNVSIVDHEKKTALHLALERAPVNVELIKYLVENGAAADIRKKDKHGVTPMDLTNRKLERSDGEERVKYKGIVDYFNDVET